MEVLDNILSWMNKNYRLIVICLLVLIVLKCCCCHKELLALVGGGSCGSHNKHSDKRSGGGYKHYDESHGGGDAKKPLTIKLFWVSWCGHCRKFKPTWEKLKTENTEDVNYEDINCEDNKEIAHQEEIEGFPTIRLYDSDNKLLEELSGSRDEESIKNLINNHK